MEMVDKLDNKRQMLNRTTERSEKTNGEYRQSVHTWIMNSKGEFYLVHQSLKLQEILFLCTKYRIGVKDITFVQANNKVNPHLVLIHGVKDAGYGLIVNKNIILNNPD